MKIAIAQMAVIQSDFDKNLQKINDFAQLASKENADLIVFPEMAVCGFHYGKNKEALLKGRNFQNEVLEISKSNKIALAASLPAIVSSEEPPANRLILSDKCGNLKAFYDKIHLFGVFNEPKYVSYGKHISIAQTEFAKTALSICYDIRFPELYIPMAENKVELILHVAAWPHPRMNQLKILSRARAVENQCFFVCVNQAGSENFGTNTINYCGSSAIIDPYGEAVVECQKDVEEIKFADIDFSLVQKSRRQIPAINDKRKDVYQSIKNF